MKNSYKIYIDKTELNNAMLMATNQTRNKVQTIDGLDEEEMSLLNECVQKIKMHVDRNIGQAKDASQMARLIVFRQFLPTD